MATQTSSKKSTPKAADKKAARVTLSSIPINRGTYTAKTTQAKRKQKPPTAAQLAKVPEQCKHGHAMKSAPENVYVYPNGGVACRECSRLIDAAARERKAKEKKAAPKPAAAAKPAAKKAPAKEASGKKAPAKKAPAKAAAPKDDGPDALKELLVLGK